MTSIEGLHCINLTFICIELQMDSAAGPSSGALGDLLRRKYLDKAEDGEIQAYM